MEKNLNDIVLYTYCKSSAAYRVRIALNIKNVRYKSHFVSLIAKGGENFQAAYIRVNPQAMLPSLKVNNDVLIQSNSIIEWLEETYPTPSLHPANSIQRAQARSFAQIIACDIHPLNNLRVLEYITSHFQQKTIDRETIKQAWYQHWIQEGFSALEKLLTDSGSQSNYCFGNQLSVADIYLIPQVYNAYRFDCDMNHFPRLIQIYDHCMKLDAFLQASPEQQKDYQV